MTHPSLDVESALEVLARGSLEIEGRLVDASNTAFLARASADGVTLTCIYKPSAGERRLWDFPDRTLAQREVATWVLSDALGWHLVPTTAWRDDGPAGGGMCQQWVEVDDDEALVDVVPQGDVPPGWLGVVDAYGPGGEPVSLVHADSLALRRLALLDAVANNADRKGGHVLVDGDGRAFGIDHGLTFHTDDKLRTVLWGWAGEPLGDPLLADLVGLQDRWGGLGLDELISGRELRAARTRLDHLVADAVFPYPGEGWPSLPWPAF